MCQTETFPLVYQDGRKVKPTKRQTTLCQYARGNQPCAGETIYRHPTQTVSYSTSTPSSSPFLNPNTFPPTPNYTPRSSTPNYRSGDESDRSGGYRSGSSSSRQRSHRPTQAPNVYVNGQRVYSSNNGERIVLVNGPPTPRTPPQNYTFPNTAPPSPVTPYHNDANPRQSSRRPVIVDDRPRIDVEFGAAPRRTHTRNTSSSSYSTQEEESSASRRQRREQEKEARRAAERQATMKARIDAANARINSRPEVPLAPRRSSTYYRDAELANEFERLNFQAKRREKQEQDAVEQRLRERLQPQRRATVGHGGRRPRVHYGEGQYRWE